MRKIRITRDGLMEAAQIIFWSLMVMMAIWSASAAFTAMVKQIHANKIHIADHEDRLRHSEQTLQQIATDLRWIRRSLEHEEVLTRQ